jgi:DNA (cytosine-5)-methyltransferase 1
MDLKPAALFLENVPGIEKYHRFKTFLREIRKLGYLVNKESLQLSDFAVPQRRRRIVVLAGLGFEIEMPAPARTRERRDVRWAIGHLPPPSKSRNRLHRETTQHDAKMLERIAAVPKDGGSRFDWPDSLALACHEDTDGFKDVYGRMSWDDPSPTITGGCINASKGRFVHPEENRAITLLEAALLQTFHASYYFSPKRGRYAIAEMIGNALPPEFARRVGCSVIRSLKNHHDD